MIALIKGLSAKLGADFPGSNNRVIPDTKIEVVGEPGPAGSGPDVASETSLSDRDFARAQINAAKTVVGPSDAANAALPADLYFAIATSMIAHADLKQPETGVFDQVVAQGADLKAVRNELGENLWSPWGEAWETASAITEADIRGPVLGRLSRIADTLTAQGVAIDDQQSRHSAMVRAAEADAAAALAELHRRGADVDFFDRSGMTPLLAAAFAGSENAAAYLLENGANLALVSRAPLDASATEDDNADLAAESCLPSSTATECAEQGKALALDDPDRLRAYEAVISMIWERENRD